MCISRTQTVDMQYDKFARTRSKQRLTAANLSANFRRSVDNRNNIIDNRVLILNFVFVVDNLCMPQLKL